MEELLKEYLKNNLVDGSYNLVLDPKNQTSFIQFKCFLDIDFIIGLRQYVKTAKFGGTYKNSTDYRKNYTTIVFFNFI